MKKLNLLLTISLVSLFISIILIIVGNINIYCLSFGFLFLAIALGLFTADRSVHWSNLIKQNKELLESLESGKDDMLAYEIIFANKKLAKQRISIIMGSVLFALLLIVLAFTIIL